MLGFVPFKDSGTPLLEGKFPLVQYILVPLWHFNLFRIG